MSVLVPALLLLATPPLPLPSRPQPAERQRPFVSARNRATAAAAPVPPTPQASHGHQVDSLPAMALDDRVRLAEAFRLSATIGPSLWPTWRAAPFAVLLITADREFLLHHDRPTAEFVRVGYDSLLGSEVHVRPRQFAPTMLATFPAVGGVPTVVIGTAATTGLSSARWVLTVLHEHVHQLQYSHPGYWEGVNALALTRGDTTGMWMLTYPFPYRAPTVVAAFARFTRAVDAALSSAASRTGGAPGAASTVTGAPSAQTVQAVRAARAGLRAAIGADDDRYFAFQMWQEGVARYTELRAARLAAAAEAPAAPFRALADYTPYSTVAQTMHHDARTALRRPALAEQQRVAFYAAGAAFALLLDATAPEWRSRYLSAGYALEPLLTPASAR